MIEEVIIGDAPTKEIEEIIVEDITPGKVIEEVIIEDASVPEIIAQEVIIKDGTITHIGAGPYNGFIQSPTAVRVPAFIAAIREDGEILSKSIIPIPLPASGDIPVPTAVSNGTEDSELLSMTCNELLFEFKTTNSINYK